MKDSSDTYREEKQLVLERLKTMDPHARILLGGDKEYNVGDLIEHVEKGDEFGKKIVHVQMRMIKILASGV